MSDSCSNYCWHSLLLSCQRIHDISLLRGWAVEVVWALSATNSLSSTTVRLAVCHPSSQHKDITSAHYQCSRRQLEYHISFSDRRRLIRAIQSYSTETLLKLTNICLYCPKTLYCPKQPIWVISFAAELFQESNLKYSIINQNNKVHNI